MAAGLHVPPPLLVGTEWLRPPAGRPEAAHSMCSLPNIHSFSLNVSSSFTLTKTGTLVMGGLLAVINTGVKRSVSTVNLTKLYQTIKSNTILDYHVSLTPHK